MERKRISRVKGSGAGKGVLPGLSLLGVSLLTASLLGGCNGIPQLPDMYRGDWEPMVLNHVAVLDTRAVGFQFNKEVEVVQAHFSPPVEIRDVQWTGELLRLDTEEPLLPGREYWVDAVLRDQSGNLASILVSFYGLNARLPRTIINEFVCKGSGNNPDFAELRVLEGGNLGGMTLYNGSPSHWTSRVILPEIEVETDDYVIVHFRPQNIPEEVTEVTDRTASGGLRSHPEAWDVWVPEGSGLPTTSGGLTLTEFPGGPLMDAVLWSDRTYDSTSDRRGFGTVAQLQIFEEVVALGGWEIAGSFVVPDDGVDPSRSTATRSISRRTSGEDTDNRGDWHITPTRGATPGTVNTDAVYEP